jgi:aminoglycoside phosphotransferase (APT) family kinase protein
MDLKLAALGCLARLTGEEEELQALYLQPDRAVYLAECAGIVLKVYADDVLLSREWRAARMARAAGVPTPELLAFVAGPPAVIAMRRVVGQPLSSAYPEAAREAGRVLGWLHGIGARPPFSTGETTWDGQIMAWAGRELASLGRLGVFDGDAIGALLGRFARLRAELASRPIVQLHGDLQPEHVLVDVRGERVVALLDFADAQPGDPLLDIAVLTLWDEALAGPILAGYRGIADDAATRALLAEYRLLRHLSEIPWLLERGYGEYATRNVAAVRRALAGGGSLA